MWMWESAGEDQVSGGTSMTTYAQTRTCALDAHDCHTLTVLLLFFKFCLPLDLGFATEKPTMPVILFSFHL